MKLNLTVKTRATRPRVEPLGPNAYKVWVRSAPEKGRANEEVIELMACERGVAKSRIVMVSGHTASKKIVEIH